MYNQVLVKLLVKLHWEVSEAPCLCNNQLQHHLGCVTCWGIHTGKACRSLFFRKDTTNPLASSLSLGLGYSRSHLDLHCAWMSHQQHTTVDKCRGTAHFAMLHRHKLHKAASNILSNGYKWNGSYETDNLGLLASKSAEVLHIFILPSRSLQGAFACFSM